MIKYIVQCPCNSYEQEYTIYEEASQDLKYKNMFGCGANCYPHRHRFLVVETESIENEEKTRENTFEVPQKASKTKFFQLDLSDQPETPEKTDENDPK